MDVGGWMVVGEWILDTWIRGHMVDLVGKWFSDWMVVDLLEGGNVVG